MPACGFHGAHAHRMYFLDSPDINMILNSTFCQRQFKALISLLYNHFIIGPKYHQTKIKEKKKTL